MKKIINNNQIQGSDVSCHKAVSLKLVHINDTHSNFEPTSLQLSLQLANEPLQPYVSAGGFARIATRVQQLKDDAQRRQRGFLFLHAGDCFQGTLYFSLYKGKANADLLNALSIDAMALGNHELDMGNEPVGQFLRRIQFPLLAGNWNVARESGTKRFALKGHPRLYSYQPASQTASYLVKTIQGEPVAIFGLSIDRMNEISNPDMDTPFSDALQTARRTVREIHDNGINKIILLSHLGYEADLQLAQDIDGIGLIVGGHSHYLQGDFSAIGLSRGENYARRVKDTFVVQAGCNALTLGHCDIHFASDGRVTLGQGQNELLLGRRMFLDSRLLMPGTADVYNQARDYIEAQNNVVVCKKDPQIQALLLEKYLPGVRAQQTQIIAHTQTKLRHVRVPDQLGGSEVAPLVARSFAWALNQRGHNVEFAIHNAGGVRCSLNEGPISAADISGKLLPFAVPVGLYDIRGQDIKACLEGAINNAINNGVQGTGAGSYPYTSNLRFHYTASAPQGARITQLQIRRNNQWQLIDDKEYYRGCSSAYTMKGKEGYAPILAMKGNGYVTQLSMADCFIEWLQKEKQLTKKQLSALYSPSKLLV